MIEACREIDDMKFIFTMANADNGGDLINKAVQEFADENEISDYARNSIAILCGLKVMNGMGDGRFAPKETATRAQAAKVIYEIAKLIK